MSDSKNIEMANLICRFGDKVMLDHFEEIVKPAFFNEDLKRTYGQADYFFSDVNFIHLDTDDGTPTIGICGRFIKDGTLTREQIFEEGKIVKSHGSMRSSPSAIFLLILNNHRLVYVKETTDGPNKDAFRSTLLAFLKHQYKSTIRSKKASIDEEFSTREERRHHKDKLLRDYESPSLNVIALTSPDSIQNFIARYELLRQIKITFSSTNDENPMNKFFTQFKHNKEAIESEKSTLIHQAKSGLDKSVAVDQINSATEQGINSVALSGIDESGDTLVGNNEKFQLKKPIDDLNGKPEEAAEQLYKAFSELVESGIVKVEKIKTKTAQKISSIFDRYFE